MFLHLPDNAWPRIVDAKASDGYMSDLLGGVAVRVGLSRNFGVYVREDSRPMPLNVPASYLATVVSRSPVPICGPAVLVALDTEAIMLEGDAVTAGRPRTTCLSRASHVEASTAATLLRAAEDAMWADLRNDKQLDDDDQILCQEHRGELIRTILGILRMLRETLPADWPGDQYERVDTDGGNTTAAVSDPRFII